MCKYRYQFLIFFTEKETNFLLLIFVYFLLITMIILKYFDPKNFFCKKCGP